MFQLYQLLPLNGFGPKTPSVRLPFYCRNLVLKKSFVGSWEGTNIHRIFGVKRKPCCSRFIKTILIQVIQLYLTTYSIQTCDLYPLTPYGLSGPTQSQCKHFNFRTFLVWSFLLAPKSVLNVVQLLLVEILKI